MKIKKTIQALESDTIVTDFVKNRDGFTVISSVASIGILIGLNIDAMVAFKLVGTIGLGIVIYNNTWLRFSKRKELNQTATQTTTQTTTEDKADDKVDNNGKVRKIGDNHVLMSDGSLWERTPNGMRRVTSTSNIAY